MNIIVYSNQAYEHQVHNLIRSLKYGHFTNARIYYYTIDFQSSIREPNVLLVPWKSSSLYPKFEFYKPEICLDALERDPSGQFLFMDADIVASKRFSKFPIQGCNGYPLFCTSFIEFPYTFRDTTIFNEKKLMAYLGVSDRTMWYVMTCLFTFDNSCKDFFEEWQSICRNQYLMKDHEAYFPFPDETIANVLLWKRGATINYGRLFVNTHKFSTFKLCEESNEIRDTLIDGNFYEQCEDSSKVYFYHATKVKEENVKILEYINENS